MNLKQFARRTASRGFTLIEMLVVVAVIGVVATIILPKLRGGTDTATSKQVDDGVHAAAYNWKLIAQQCSTPGDVTTSVVVGTPSATNSLALIVNGSTYLNASYTGCYTSSGVVPLVGKFAGNPTSGFTIAGYGVTWSGGASSTPISFVIPGMSTDVVLPLYQQYSSDTGARNATALPAAANTTDPVIRYTAPSNGTTTLTFLVY